MLHMLSSRRVLQTVQMSESEFHTSTCRLGYDTAYKHCPLAQSDEVPCYHSGSTWNKRSNCNSRQQSHWQTFAKVVSSYDYYCNPAKFAESDTSRRQNIQQMAELLHLVIRDEVLQVMLS